jgi:flagellar biosynthesis chaperone FliJ
MTKSLEYYHKCIEIEQEIEQEIEKNMLLIQTLSEGDLVNQKAMYRYLEKMRLDLQDQKRNVKMAKTVYENKKSEYITAQKERKVIEKHKTGYLEKLKDELKRLDNIQNNELAIATFNRGRSYR